MNGRETVNKRDLLRAINTHHTIMVNTKLQRNIAAFVRVSKTHIRETIAHVNAERFTILRQPGGLYIYGEKS
jgi:hypothetical protein